MVRARLNDLVGSYESDPVLKAFLMSSIQPKDNNDSAGGSGGGSGSSGSSSSGGNANSNHVTDSITAGDEVEALFTKIQRNKRQSNPSTTTTTTTTTATTTTATVATTTAAAAITTATAIGGPSVGVSNPNPGPAPLEWKFSVEGIYQSRFAVAQFLSDNPSDDATATATASDSSDGASSSILVFKRPVLVMKGATSPFVRYAQKKSPYYTSPRTNISYYFNPELFH